MQDFAYSRARTVEEAIARLSAGARIIAGGTELLNWLRLGIADASELVDISRLPELRGIKLIDNAIHIGALSTLNEIGENLLIREHAPLLSEACLSAASAQIRNRATLGGNILQKTRCPYFRAEAPGVKAMPWPCNKREHGTGCAARDSGNPRLALFGGTSDCVATQPSDPAVALAALDARITIKSPRSQRIVAMTQFHLTQVDAGGVRENCLAADEIVTSFCVPLDKAAARSAYLKVRERASYEYAMLSVAICLSRSATKIDSLRIALGSVAQKPWRLFEAEALLLGTKLDNAKLQKVIAGALAEATPPAGNEFKIALATNAVLRAVQIADLPG